MNLDLKMRDWKYTGNMTVGRLERKGRVEITTFWLSGVSHGAENTITTLLCLHLE